MKSVQTMAQLKSMAGVGPASYAGWQQPSASTAESVSLSISNARIRRMAHLLEDERLGGTLLPKFDWDRFDKLLNEAAPQWSGDLRSRRAHALHHSELSHAAHRAGDKAAPAQAHQIHLASQSRHAAEADRLRSFDPAMSKWHDTMAWHHGQHAAHHAARMGGLDHTQHSPPSHAENPAAAGPKGLAKKTRSKKPVLNMSPRGGSNAREAPKKAKAPPAKPDRIVAPKDATVHWRPGMEGPAPTKPQRSRADMPGYEGVPHETQAHAAAAHKSTEIAHGLAKAGAASKYAAHAHGQAAHDHLHAALSLFHGGHHDKALEHFKSAIHQMRHAGSHVADAEARGRQKARQAAPAGPRAVAGRAHV